MFGLEVFGKVADIVAKVVPDRDLATKINAELEKQLVSNDFELARGQQKVNEVEAANASVFVSGWRPAIGWICAIGLAYQFLIYPLITWANAIWVFAKTAPPDLDGNTLMALVTGMLGIAGYHTFQATRKAGKQ